MAPVMAQDRNLDPDGGPPGPHPSFIQVAKPYVFEQNIEECLKATGATEAKEDNVRLQGVAWIDNVRKALQLPVRTYNTAVVYYHKFRLVHPDVEYNFIDASAAALFTACKIEDTLKKSKEILCAAYNMKLSPSEHLTPDDPLFENHSKAIIGLERLMLEASGFDFRNRYPQKLLVKLLKYYHLDNERVRRTSYNMCLDLYRTFAPVKQTTAAMAIACIELSARMHGSPIGRLAEIKEYRRWSTSRAQVMETILDLLDLYTHHRAATIVGQDHALESFIAIRITFNQESASLNLPRHTERFKHPSASSSDATTRTSPATNGTTTHPYKKPRLTSPDDRREKEREREREREGARDRDTPTRARAIKTSPSLSPPPPAHPQTQTPLSAPLSASATATSLTPSSALGTTRNIHRSGGARDGGIRDGTVRFMLDAERARDEKRVVETFFKVEEEEVEIDVEVEVEPEGAPAAGAGG
ncbi:MAG: hypothetical protein M1819_007472, partial [Sarea resinae]